MADNHEKQRPITHRACRPLVCNRMSSHCQTESLPSLSSTKTGVRFKAVDYSGSSVGGANGVADDRARRQFAGNDSGYFIPIKIRSQRILSKKEPSLSQLSQTNKALPTMWSSGTKPHVLASSELCRLSPIIQ